MHREKKKLRIAKKIVAGLLNEVIQRYQFILLSDEQWLNGSVRNGWYSYLSVLIPSASHRFKTILSWRVGSKCQAGMVLNIIVNFLLSLNIKNIWLIYPEEPVSTAANVSLRLKKW